MTAASALLSGMLGMGDSSESHHRGIEQNAASLNPAVRGILYMAKSQVDQHYSLGRSHPHGKPHDVHPKDQTPKHGGGDGLELDPKLNFQHPQDRSDQHAKNYDNDTPD